MFGIEEYGKDLLELLVKYWYKKGSVYKF